MKTYMSLWTKGLGFNNTHLNVWKLSLALAKKHYTSVELITDSDGYEIMQNLPFSNFHIELDNIPQYSTMWCLGKIYAYKYACSVNEPFLHLDGDVLLWEALPTNLINSPIFAQSKDYSMGSNDIYNAQKLQLDSGCAVPGDWLFNNGVTTYIMAIFGGSNTALINEYCDFVINMINNPLYNNLWLSNIGSVSKSCLTEQGNLGIYCKNNNVIPAVLFEDNLDSQKLTYKKYSHIANQKGNPILLDRIANRISQEPYDLMPRDVPIEEWHSIQ